MLWIDGVETAYLQSWLHGWDYLRIDNSFYKIVGEPVAALRQEAIDKEIEEFKRTVSSKKQFRCWVKPR